MFPKFTSRAIGDGRIAYSIFILMTHRHVDAVRVDKL